MQVFMLAREAMPYDEEFLLAAILHDVGKAIDPDDHVVAGLEALDGFITERTSWLIALRRCRIISAPCVMPARLDARTCQRAAVSASPADSQ